MFTAGDAWGLLCGYFPAIDTMYQVQKCRGIAHGERVTHRSGNIIYLTDPPGVTGTAPGSGGSLATLGVVLYLGVTPSTSEHNWGYGIAMGCSLPTSQASTCQTLLQNFVARH
jgi:hypothetical protein